MKKIILICYLLPHLAFSQQYKDFCYERVVAVDNFIVKIESYDSKTGIYSRIRCDINEDAPMEEKVVIPITEKEKSDLWELRKEFGDFVFGECTSNKNVTLRSNFFFENEKYPPKCIETERQKEQFIKLSIGLRLLLESKPEYRKAFYWEFIKR
ncbi:hypothetical protein EG347_16405 [Chryseobacterium sp. G0186]|uniref:hypothetical protein n=1 Tax=Chryseobacterium sp. G0186 TaxID=2487064 RepID=UPI000F4EC040|nr:hypothetical protein [Chryseobacterium sp. G0186]AZA78982.1 hypothetical protein EG347_16405 [Chryseobacterium sp. G0186]